LEYLVSQWAYDTNVIAMLKAPTLDAGPDPMDTETYIVVLLFTPLNDAVLGDMLVRLTVCMDAPLAEMIPLEVCTNGLVERYMYDPAGKDAFDVTLT